MSAYGRFVIGVLCGACQRSGLGGVVVVITTVAVAIFTIIAILAIFAAAETTVFVDALVLMIVAVVAVVAVIGIAIFFKSAIAFVNGFKILVAVWYDSGFCDSITIGSIDIDQRV